MGHLFRAIPFSTPEDSCYLGKWGSVLVNSLFSARNLDFYVKPSFFFFFWLYCTADRILVP